MGREESKRKKAPDDGASVSQVGEEKKPQVTQKQEFPDVRANGELAHEFAREVHRQEESQKQRIQEGREPPELQALKRGGVHLQAHALQAGVFCRAFHVRPAKAGWNLGVTAMGKVGQGFEDGGVLVGRNQHRLRVPDAAHLVSVQEIELLALLFHFLEPVFADFYDLACDGFEEAGSFLVGA